MIVDWETYYDAADKCRELAEGLRTADKPVHDAVRGECAGMAGDAPGCREWGQAYDEAARRTLQACASLANALTNYSAVLYAQGYHWGIANKSHPPPQQPDIRQVSEYKVDIPTSAHGSGIGFGDNGGVEEFFDDLVHRVAKAFGMLPNGDSGKMHKTAETWRVFADNPIILEAADRITAISDLFIAMDADNHRNEIQGHLNDLRTSAKTVSLAANRMAPPVDDYYEALIALSTACTDRIILSESSVGVTATARHGVSGSLFDIGLPASAAARGNKVSVDGTMDAIQSAYQASTLPDILGMRALDAGAKGAVAAFNDVPATGLDSAIARLSVIIAMRATLDENSGPGSTSSAPGSIDESAKKFNDREKRIAVLQASEGHHVRAVPESNVPGRRTADAEVDGVPTEYKSLDPGATNGTVKNQLNSAQGQADHAVLDARGSGLSEEEARRGMNRYLGANDGKMTDIRIIGDGWEIRWP